MTYAERQRRNAERGRWFVRPRVRPRTQYDLLRTVRKIPRAWPFPPPPEAVAHTT